MTTKLILGLAIAGLAAAWIGSNHTPAYAANQIQMRHDLRLRVEFELSAIPTSPVFTLKKPPNISAWTLNGRDLIGPPKDMFYPELEGIPVSALKAGKFLVFKADDKQCELKAWTFGGLQTPDNERKLELVDTRVWKARKQAGGSATQ